MAYYHKAEILRQKRSDAERWEMGLYNLCALTSALSKALGGKKGKKVEYVKEPVFAAHSTAISDAEMTEEEKEMERNKLLMSLQTMQANFELSHNQGKGDE